MAPVSVPKTVGASDASPEFHFRRLVIMPIFSSKSMLRRSVKSTVSA
jgi:hypothetical protein